MRRGLRVMALAGLVGGLGAAASLSEIGFTLEEEIGLGWLFQLRGARPAPPEAVVVRFDRDALARLRDLPAADAWPQPLKDCRQRFGGLDRLREARTLDRLPRAVHACLVRELTRRGAATIAFDIAFREDPSREEGVPALAEAMRAHGRVILLEKAIRDSRAAPHVQADLLEGRPHAALTAAAAATASFLLPQPRTDARVHQFWTRNPALALPTQLPMRALEVAALPALQRLAAGMGAPLPADLPAAEALLRATGWLRPWSETSPTPPLPSGGNEARALQALVRAYRGPEGHYLNFYGPPGTLPSLSAADLLLSGQVPPPDLSGRTVFVGYQELAVPQAGDSFPTVFQSPAGVDLSGVEIAATAFTNLLHGETLRALPEGARVLLVALLGAGFTLASCLGMVGRGLVATLTLAAAYAGVAVACFALGNLWLPMVVPLLGLLPAAIGLGQAVRYRGAARWLTVYTPRPVSRHLLQGREFATARPQRREVTVMMTDIAGFTALAERTTPEALTEFVNRHFTLLTRCVEAEGGTVAQFIGDSMMAFWGAPVPQPDHAARACRTALAIAEALACDQERHAVPGGPQVRLRIGVNTGEVTAGNVGAPGRCHYGIVGDAVNTTQRIEQLAKQICPDGPPVAILVSAVTRAHAGDAFDFVDAGSHAVRGREGAVRIYRLAGRRDEAASLRPAPLPDGRAAALPRLVPAHG